MAANIGVFVDPACPWAWTPVIAVETDPPTALSGPIVSSVPAGADALRLWDAFAALLESRAFLEARRARSLPQFPQPVKSLA
ncbi:MAG TPA: hypothetical protein VIV12_07575 [Streptosporangiaceae bacterium]